MENKLFLGKDHGKQIHVVESTFIWLLNGVIVLANRKMDLKLHVEFISGVLKLGKIITYWSLKCNYSHISIMPLTFQWRPHSVTHSSADGLRCHRFVPKIMKSGMISYLGSRSRRVSRMYVIVAMVSPCTFLTLL